jgi:hypothetical protein
MALSLEINRSEPDGKYVDRLWKNFVENYTYIEKKGLFIQYPDKVYKEQGIPTPWQTIAWRKIIAKIGEENFSKLPFKLNYLEEPDVLFEKIFTDRFANHTNPERLRVTFVCGYFWRYNENRRDKMLEFVVKSLLEKGTIVEIWTQDMTLAESFGEKIGISPIWDRLHLKFVKERIDVHYTLIEDENATDNSLLLLELPHTEAHLFRLEICLTFGKLKEFGCNPDDFKKFLYSYTKPGFARNFLPKFNCAYNRG